MHFFEIVKEFSKDQLSRPNQIDGDLIYGRLQIKLKENHGRFTSDTSFVRCAKVSCNSMFYYLRRSSPYRRLEP